MGAPGGEERAPLVRDVWVVAVGAALGRGVEQLEVLDALERGVAVGRLPRVGLRQRPADRRILLCLHAPSCPRRRQSGEPDDAHKAPHVNPPPDCGLGCC